MHDHAVEPSPDARWLDTEALLLRDGVEVITGAGGRTMLVSPAGRFLAVSPSGLAVIRQFGDGRTGRDLVDRLTREHGGTSERTRVVVPAFLADLRRAGVLTVEPDQPAKTRARAGLTALGHLDPVRRFPLVDDPGRLLRPVVDALLRVPARLLCTLLLAVPLLSLPLVVLALGTTGVVPAHPSPVLSLAAVGVLVCQVVLHETCHVVAMAYNRLRPRNAGLGLLFYALPIAYVDRTESYRHRGRPGRVLISLVGPLNDLFWAGVSAAVLLTATGTAAQFCHVLLLLQLVSLLANVNPLFPSDGYHAIEAGVGSINMRGRALSYVLHRLSSRPLPGHLAAVGPGVRAGYVVYVVLSIGYTLLVLAGVLYDVVALVGRVPR
jgi:putative peptide zinc metalloprotease protein